jgi:hypothetical protein
MTPDDIDVGNPDAYVAGVPHNQFAFLRRHAPVFRHREANGPGSTPCGAMRASTSRQPFHPSGSRPAAGMSNFIEGAMNGLFARALT